eukprot:m.460188 g.460188  ORF g.460188 m.460188 type:complete len:497 (+) comp21962_c0_seq1:208-1698(+)
MGLASEANATAEAGLLDDFFDPESLRMDEETLATVVSAVMMGLLALRVAYWIATYRSLFIGVATAWVLWLGHALLFREGTTMDDVVARGVAVRLAAKSLVLALEKFMVASTNLVLPFWSDLAVVAYATWTVLDNRTKGWVVLVVAVGYSLVAAYRKAVKLKDKHGGTVKALLFQASFLIAAPALWFGSLYLLPGSLLPLVVSGLLSVAPAAYSCVAFASSGAGTVRGLFHMGKRPQSQVELEMGRCLSYWSCWPTVKFVADLVASTSYGEVSEVQRGLLVLLVWLQVWDGSKHIPDLVWRMAVDVGLPIWKMSTTNLPQWVQNPTAFLWENFGTVSRVYNYVKENKAMAVAAGIGAALLVSRILGVFSSLFTMLIWWGASLKTTKKVHKYAHHRPPHHDSTDEYRPMLAFWLLGILYDCVLLLPIPLFATLLSLWEPVFLAVSLSMGDTVLDTLLTMAAPFIALIPDPMAKGKPGRGGTPRPTSTAAVASAEQHQD